MKANEGLNLLRVHRNTLTKYITHGIIRVVELPNDHHDYNDDDA